MECAQTLRPTLQLIVSFDPEVILIDSDASSASKVRRITQAAKAYERRPFVVLVKSGRAAPQKIFYYDKLLSRPFIFKRLQNTIDRLVASRSQYVIQLPPFTLDCRTHNLAGPKGKVHLTPKEFKLMETFIRHPGETISQLHLMKEVWNTTMLQDIRTLHVHIHWLRKVIEEDVANPTFLKTSTKNKGYILDIADAPQIGGEPIFLD